MRNIYLILVLIFYSATVCAQNGNPTLKVKSYHVSDGLSQSSIQDIMQDVFGFIWISTGDGLNCFDGSSFKRYYFHSLSGDSEHSNSMRKVLGDDIGNLWVGTNRGLLFLDRSKDILTIAFPGIAELSNHTCLPLFCTNDSITILVAGKGILSIHIKEQKFKWIPFSASPKSLLIFEDSHQEKWMGFDPLSLVRFTNHPTTGIKHKEYRLKNSEYENFVSVVRLSEEISFIATTKSLYRLFESSGQIEQIDLGTLNFLPENLSFNPILEDNNGKIWLPTSNHGIFILNKDLTLHRHIKTFEENEQELYTPRYISYMFSDSDGNIWIGTDGAGISVYANQKRKFGLINLIELPDKQIREPFVRCFLQDEQNQLWIGTYNSGLICWNRESNTFLQLLPGKESANPLANDIYSLAPLSENRILAGTSSGLWVINVLNREFYPIEKIIPGAFIEKVNCIVPHGLNSYELLINNTPHSISIKDGKLSIHQSVFPDSLESHIIYAVSNKVRYSFSKSGFYQASDGVLKFNNYFYKGQEVKLKVNAVYETDSLLWLTTDRGLVKLETNGKIRSVYNETNGFQNPYLYGILTDKRNNLWISSNRGLSEFDVESGHIVNYGMSDGLQSLEFNSGAYYKNQQGEMFFGGVRGFNYFYPDSIHSKSANRTLYIRNIQVNDQLYEADTCWMAKKTLDLTYAQNTVTFELIELDYLGMDKHLIKYMLVGYDKEWISSDNISNIRYAKLAPGKYSFQVMNKSPEEMPDRKPIIFYLHIQKPFWMETWFLVLASAIILSVIILVVRYFSTLKMKRQIAALERQNEISLIRRRIASDLHDDVGSGLSKLAMMSDKARMNLRNEDESGNYLLKLSTESRRMIDQLRVIVWALNPQEDKLDGLIAYLHGHIRDYLEDFPIQTRFTIPDDIPPISVSPEFKRNVYYAIREAVHNAVKHSGAKNLEIMIKIENKHLQATIVDNGQGFDQSLQGKSGNGIKFMKKRIADLEGKLSISSNPGSGTTVEFVVPL